MDGWEQDRFERLTKRVADLEQLMEALTKRVADLEQRPDTTAPYGPLVAPVFLPVPGDQPSLPWMAPTCAPRDMVFDTGTGRTD